VPAYRTFLGVGSAVVCFSRDTGGFGIGDMDDVVVGAADWRGRGLLWVVCAGNLALSFAVKMQEESEMLLEVPNGRDRAINSEVRRLQIRDRDVHDDFADPVQLSQQCLAVE
jgi:hypothetical protein